MYVDSKIFVSQKNVGSIKLWVPKKFVEKKLCLKKCGSQKKKFQNKICLKKMRAQKNVDPKKFVEKISV